MASTLLIIASLFAMGFVATVETAAQPNLRSVDGKVARMKRSLEPNFQDACDNVTSLYEKANSTCNPGSTHQIFASNYNNKTHAWSAFVEGVRAIVKVYIEEPKRLIEPKPWHELLINSSSSFMTIEFQAPTKQTYIRFGQPLALRSNSGNVTIVVKKKKGNEVLNMQEATISLYGIPDLKSCSANSCLDGVYEWMKIPDCRKQCINDTSHLMYWYGDCVAPPKITSPPTNQRVKTGARVTLTCRAEAPTDQNVTFTWYKDDRPLNLATSDSYTIPSVELRDQGSYKCKVSTRYGSVTSAAATVMLTEMQAKTTLLLSIKKKRTDSILDPQEITNSIKMYLNSAKTKWKFDVQFKRVSKSSAKSVTIELMITSSIDPDDIKSYYSQEQRLLEEGAKRNSFKGFKLYSSKVQIESPGFCLAEITGKSNIKGEFHWPLTAVNQKANVSCPYGQPGAQAQRNCTGSFLSDARWSFPDDSSCGFMSNTTEGLEKLSKKNITKDNADKIVKEAKQLTKNTAKNELNSADIVFVANIIDGALNSGSVNSTGQDIIDIVDTVMAANKSVLREGQKSNGTASKFVKLIDSIAASLPIAAGEMSRTLVAPNLMIQAVVTDAQQFKGYALASRAAGIGTNDSLTRDAISTESLPAGQIQTGIFLPQSIAEQFDKSLNRPVRLGLTIYQNAKFFQTVSDDEEEVEIVRNWTVNSRVISSSVVETPISNLSEPIEITFEPLTRREEYPVCVFWDFTANDGRGNWSTEGCEFVAKPSGRIRCHCDHMTNFAVLFTANGPHLTTVVESHRLALSIISYTGCAISLLGVLLTLVTYAMFRTLRKTHPQHILMNLCVALALLLVVFIVGANRPGGLPGCRAVAALLHYFVLAVVLWMGVEGYQMYLAFVRIYATYQSRFMLKVSTVAWGLPAIIVAITVAVATDSYGNEDNCVLTGIPFYAAMFAPVLVIIAVNFIVFFCVMWKLARGTPVVAANRPSNLRSRTALGIMILLGLTWVFGALAVRDAKLVFEYLFCIFNSFQGFFIFIFYCVMRSEVRKQYRELYWRKTVGYKVTDTKSTGITTNEMYSLQRRRGRLGNGDTKFLTLNKKDGNDPHLNVPMAQV